MAVKSDTLIGMSELADLLDEHDEVGYMRCRCGSQEGTAAHIAEAILALPIQERAALVGIILTPDVPITRMTGRGKGQRYGRWATPLLPWTEEPDAR